MNFPEIVEKVQVKSKQALDSHLVGNTTAAVEALQEVATLINSEFGATDEVAADTPEDEEEAKTSSSLNLRQVIAGVAKYADKALADLEGGDENAAKDCLAEAAGLVHREILDVTKTEEESD